MIEKKKSRKSYYMKDSIMKSLGESPTADDVLNLILPDHDGCPGDYVLYQYDYPQDRTIMNRINYCWVFPLFLVSIPFSWIFTGDWGLNRNSKIGRIVDWLIKFDR